MPRDPKQDFTRKQLREARERCGNKCEGCDEEKPLEGHHGRSVRRHGTREQRPIMLCKECHTIWGKPDMLLIWEENRREKLRENRRGGGQQSQTNWPSRTLKSKGFNKTKRKRMDGTVEDKS